MSTSHTSPASPTDSPATAVPGLRSALTRYRVIAYVVGVMLLLLVFVAMPLKYFADDPSAMDVIGPLHGFLFVFYLLLTLDLARRARFGLVKTVLVGLAGTIPFLSFVAERKITHQLTR